MNRIEFLKTCAGGLCACAAFGVPTAAIAESATAEPPKPEDWRLQFIKRRYAKLLENLEGRVGERTLDEILQQQGRFCASTTEMIQKHKGDIDGFIQDITREWKQQITYDREQGVITAAGPEVKECFCPLIDGRYTPKSACDCSLGWTQYAYETVLGKPVQVELKESVLRGGKRCTFIIRIAAPAMG
jgi:predicted ArsR family transcriptional regulator